LASDTKQAAREGGRECVRACVRASVFFWGLAYYQGKDIVLRPIIEYSSLRDFYRPQGNNNNNNNNRSIFIWGFLKHDILACVKTWNY
jgi:hypothetical protein